MTEEQIKQVHQIISSQSLDVNKIVGFNVNLDLERAASIKENFRYELKEVIDKVTELGFVDCYGNLVWTKLFPHDSVNVSFCKKCSFDGTFEITYGRTGVIFGVFIRNCGDSITTYKTFHDIKSAFSLLESLKEKPKKQIC